MVGAGLLIRIGGKDRRAAPMIPDQGRSHVSISRARDRHVQQFGSGLVARIRRSISKQCTETQAIDKKQPTDSSARPESCNDRRTGDMPARCLCSFRFCDSRSASRLDSSSRLGPLQLLSLRHLFVILRYFCLFLRLRGHHARLLCSRLILGLPSPSYSPFPLFLHATAITYRSAFFVLRATVATDSNVFKHWRIVKLKASKQRSELHFLLFSLRASDSTCLKTRARRSAYNAMILKSRQG